MPANLSVARLLLTSFFALSLCSVAPAQSRTSNDGFQRRDGAMYVIRNGVKRPMTHDVHLPNGRVITHDGFVVARDGQRTELAEGKGCDLSGRIVSVTPGANGQLRLAAAPSSRNAAVGTAAGSSYLRQLLGAGKHRGWGHYKKNKKGKRKKHDD